MWIAILGGGTRAAVVAVVLVGYAGGFVVVFAWTHQLHRRSGITAPHRSALPAGLLGGALGGLCVLALLTARSL